MSPDTIAWFLSVTSFALSMAATPGPNNAMVAASGATFGFARTMPHMLGIVVGFPVMIVAVALGAGDVFRAVPMLHQVLKWIGVAYLLWLAFHIARSRPAMPSEATARGVKPLSFLQGAAFQWINPKAWIIALGAVATYTTSDAIFSQAILLASIFLVVTVPTIAFWTLTGVGAARLLRSEQALRRFNLAMAALLVLSLLPLLREA